MYDFYLGQPPGFFSILLPFEICPFNLISKHELPSSLAWFYLLASQPPIFLPYSWKQNLSLNCPILAALWPRPKELPFRTFYTACFSLFDLLSAQPSGLLHQSLNFCRIPELVCISLFPAFTPVLCLFLSVLVNNLFKLSGSILLSDS